MPRKTKKQTRRGNKEGSIYQRKDGKWCGQVLIGYNELGKPVRKTFYGETRQDVARKISEATHQVFSGALTVPNRMPQITVEELVSDFLWTFKKPTISDATFEWYLVLTKNHIIPAIGSIKARELTSRNIQSLLNALYAKKMAQRTLKGVRDTLNQAFKQALEQEIVKTNPVEGAKMPKASRVKAEQKEEAKAIPVADRAKILAAAENDLRMKTAITVLMFTGMRIGEFLALTWGNVDFRKNCITIDRALTRRCEYDDGKLTKRTTVVCDTKTQCSTRKIKVSPIVTDILREWWSALPEHMRVTPKRDILAPDAVVFPNDMGQMRSYNGFRTTYRRFMAENGLGGYPLHSYRHTFATMLLEKSVNPKVVQKLLGHRDIETTLGIYSHVLPEVYDGAADAIGGCYQDVFAGCT